MMEKLNGSTLDLGMDSLTGVFGNGEVFTIVAYGWKAVTTKDGEDLTILVIATDDGQLLATRSGGLVHQWKQLLVSEHFLPDALSVRLKEKEIKDDNYPAGATTWEFKGVYVPSKGGAGNA